MELKEIAACEYSDITEVYQGIFLLEKSGKQAILQDKEGCPEIVVPFDKYDFISYLGNYFFKVKKNETYQLLDKNFIEKGVKANNMKFLQENLFAFQTPAKWVLFDLVSNKYLHNNGFDSIETTELPEVFIVKNNDLYGLIDHLGEITLPVEYDLIKYLNNGYFLIKNTSTYIGLVKIS
ncbi:MAG TPA: WG repeat-containing protein [Candidatus Absconditabacterales bacterium]|nr:WG repeat-containing protein [Candidatus Absconditabacterales bacterium]HMT27332.1 WG repeat-containing protein [Candidatus Absconditabacterales bacterium]